MRLCHSSSQSSVDFCLNDNWTFLVTLHSFRNTDAVEVQEDPVLCQENTQSLNVDVKYPFLYYLDSDSLVCSSGFVNTLCSPKKYNVDWCQTHHRYRPEWGRLHPFHHFKPWPECLLHLLVTCLVIKYPSGYFPVQSTVQREGRLRQKLFNETVRHMYEDMRMNYVLTSLEGSGYCSYFNLTYHMVDDFSSFLS